MATQIQPEFSGGITEDFATLVDVFRSEVRVAAGRSEPFFDPFSLAVNDGISMLVSRTSDIELDDAADPCCEYSLEGLAVEQEALETQYWKLEDEGAEALEPDELASLDRKVLELYDQACTKGHGGSLTAGAHVRFSGDATRPQWSLFIQNEGLRKIACAADAQISVQTLFSSAAEGEGPLEVVYMSHLSPFPPLCLTIPRAVMQLRAQCLSPEAIFFARRGLVLRASSPEQLWTHYCAITQRITADIRSRLRKLPWIFQGTGDLLPEGLVEPAHDALQSCLGDDVSLKMWESSREGVLRKALCSPELIDVVEHGFPDLHTASLGGLRALVVTLEENETPGSVKRKVEQSWKAYEKELTEEYPLPPKDTPHIPSVIVLANLGVMTTPTDPMEAQAAYSALAESVSVLEGARAYGGMVTIPYKEAVPIAASPVRRPSAAAAVGVGIVGTAEGQEGDTEEDDLIDLQEDELSVEGLQIEPPSRLS